MKTVMTSLARLLDYPAEGYAGEVEMCIQRLQNELGGDNQASDRLLAAMDELQKFHDVVAERELTELQEMYTRTFDINPVCCLNVGWHLYGENYNRGTFLVEMREALRRHGVEEGAELPDHLPTLLRLLPLMDTAEADQLLNSSILPALEKMLGAFEGKGDPLEHLVKAVRLSVADNHPIEAGGNTHG